MLFFCKNPSDSLYNNFGYIKHSSSFQVFTNLQRALTEISIVKFLISEAGRIVNKQRLLAARSSKREVQKGILKKDMTHIQDKFDRFGGISDGNIETINPQEYRFGVLKSEVKSVYRYTYPLRDKT